MKTINIYNTMTRDGDYGETYGVYEFNTVRKKYLTKMIQEAKWNPVFWISVLFSIFSIVAICIHAAWNFVFGAVFSAGSLIFGGICIYMCFISRFKKPWYQLWKREVARIVLFCIFVLTLQGLFIALNGELLKNHFVGEDPAWDGFPSSCDPTLTHKSGVILNCVRTGTGIPNPYTSPGLDPISEASFNGTSSVVLAQLTTIAESHMNCDHVRTGSDWTHFRCLSILFGVPSDLAIRVVPNGDKSNVWVHSQWRAASWDRNANDALVRLLFSYKRLCDFKLGGITCKS